GRPGRHGDRDHDIADTPFLLPGTRLTAHLHRPGALHLPVAHADGAHHPHHALGRLELALGVDEEVGAGHDAFPGGEAFQHLDVVVEAAAELHVARHELSVGRRDEDHLPAAGVEHGGLEARHAFARRDVELDVAVYLG